jgi:hypothetical protein
MAVKMKKKMATDQRALLDPVRRVQKLRSALGFVRQ